MTLPAESSAYAVTVQYELKFTLGLQLPLTREIWVSVPAPVGVNVALVAVGIEVPGTGQTKVLTSR